MHIYTRNLKVNEAALGRLENLGLSFGLSWGELGKVWEGSRGKPGPGLEPVTLFSPYWRSCGGAAAAAQLRRRADMLGAGKRQRLRPLVGTWRGGHSSLILALARPCARQSGTESEGAGRILKRQGRGGTAGPAWNGRAGVERQGRGGTAGPGWDGILKRQGRGGTASSNGRDGAGRHPQTAGPGGCPSARQRGQ